MKVFIVFEGVANHRTEKNDVTASTQGQPDIGHRRSAIEAGVDVNNLRSALAGSNYPLKSHGMILSHGRSHDENSVSVAEILLGGSRAAAPKACAQTGHG
jgi:hypothetical protein